MLELQNTYGEKEGGVPIPICWDGGRWIGWVVAGSDERLEGRKGRAWNLGKQGRVVEGCLPSHTMMMLCRYIAPEKS